MISEFLLTIRSRSSCKDNADQDLKCSLHTFQHKTNMQKTTEKILKISRNDSIITVKSRLLQSKHRCAIWFAIIIKDKRVFIKWRFNLYGKGLNMGLICMGKGKNMVYLTLFHILQICSGRLRKQFGKYLCKWKFNNWIELTTLWQKENYK